MNVGRVEQIHKLNTVNYETWKIQMRSVLRYNELWGYVNGQIPRPEENPEAWISKDEKALDLIMLSVDPDQLNYIKKAEMSKEAWDALKNVYESKNPMRQVVLFKKLLRLHKTAEQNITQHINVFMRIAEQLEECGLKLPEKLLPIWLLSTLPSEYETFTIAIESREKMPDLEELKTKLLEEEERRTQSKEQGNVNTEALYTNKKTSQAGKHANSNSHQEDGKRVSYKCYACGKKGHIAKNCRSKRKWQSKEHEKAEAMKVTALSATPQAPNVWCLDSGASTHICYDVNKFSDLNRQDRTPVYTGTARRVNSQGNGEVRIKVKSLNGEVSDVKLAETMLVQEFKSNLLSVSSITKHGYKVEFFKDCALIKRKNGSVVMKATLKDGLYLIEEEQIKFATLSKVHDNNLTKWHHRLGHLNYEDIRRMKNMVIGMDDDLQRTTAKTCEVCCKAKIHQLPYSSSKTREKQTLGLIHSDICGPMQTESLGGAKYFATFIDDKTRYTEVTFLKNRADIFKAFVEYKAKVERCTGQLLKKIRTDNAKEYTSRDFTEFLKKEGISRQLTVQYTPQQNGVAERANRTLVEMARSMLTEASLPYSLWAEAVNMAVYIRNRCPTKALSEMTPFEAWTGEKPYVGYMRIFGSKLIALDKRHRGNKFAPKGKEFLLVGYSEESKAYRVWERGTRNVEKHRDVKFIEDNINTHMVNEELCEMPLNLNQQDKKETLREQDPEEDFVEAREDGSMEEDEEDEEEEEYVSDEEAQVIYEEQVPTTIPTERSQLRRAGGRPKVLRTGKPGRPKKVYRYRTNITQLSEPLTVNQALRSAERNF